MPGLLDHRKRVVPHPLRLCQLAFEVVDLGELVGLLSLQIFPAFHHLQQRVLQAGLATLQRLEFVLQIGDLLGAGGSGLQHRAVPVLTPPNRIYLGLELGDLGIQVLERKPQRRQPVVGLAVLGLSLLEALLFGQVTGSVFDPAELGIHICQLEQRTLLDDFSFHSPFLSMFHGSVRMADTRTGSESPKWPRSSPAA